MKSLKDDLTGSGIKAENIRVFAGSEAGPLDPNKDDSVSEKGVIFTEGTIDGDVYAGHSTGENGKAEKNSVIVSGGTVNDKVTMNGGQVSGSVYGGYTTGADGKADNECRVQVQLLKQLCKSKWGCDKMYRHFVYILCCHLSVID